MEGVSGVFHIAGVVIHSRTGGDLYEDYPKIVFETNVDYSVNVVDAAAIAKLFLFFVKNFYLFIHSHFSGFSNGK